MGGKVMGAYIDTTEGASGLRKRSSLCLSAEDGRVQRCHSSPIQSHQQQLRLLYGIPHVHVNPPVRTTMTFCRFSAIILPEKKHLSVSEGSGDQLRHLLTSPAKTASKCEEQQLQVTTRRCFKSPGTQVQPLWVKVPEGQTQLMS